MSTWFSKSDDDEEPGLQDQGVLGAEVAGEADPDEEALRDEADAAIQESAQIVAQEEAQEEAGQGEAPTASRPRRSGRKPFPWEKKRG